MLALRLWRAPVLARRKKTWGFLRGERRSSSQKGSSPPKKDRLFVRTPLSRTEVRPPLHRCRLSPPPSPNAGLFAPRRYELSAASGRFITPPQRTHDWNSCTECVEWHVAFEHVAYTDHACLDLLMNWARQHASFGDTG